MALWNRGLMSYTLIQSNQLSGGETSISFLSIPQDYTHLNIKISGTTSANSALEILFNDDANDTGYSNINAENMVFFRFGSNSNRITAQGGLGDGPGVGVFNIKIVNYTDDSKAITMETVNAFRDNDQGDIILAHTMVRNGAASIGSFVIGLDAGTFNSDVKFELYGVV